VSNHIAGALASAVRLFRIGRRMDRETRLKRLRFRAWHRGTREADFMIGGFFDRYGESWNDEQIGWFEALMDEQDVDIMAWAIGTAQVPERWEGPMIDALKELDYIQITK
jgi:antitoxin CptB